MRSIVQLRPPDSGDRAHRVELGEAAEGAALACLLEAVPGRVTAYRNVFFSGETMHEAAMADLDLLVMTQSHIYAIGVTATRHGPFGKRQGRLVGHPGAARQVRQMTTSFRTLGASCVGRLAAITGIPLAAVLALQGEWSEQLRAQPYFDLGGVPNVTRGIDVVRVQDLGGFVRGRARSGCSAAAIAAIESQFERVEGVRFGEKVTRHGAVTRHQSQHCAGASA
jgi:hypothetical protein